MQVQSEIDPRSFAANGFLGPLRVFSAGECKEIAAQLRWKSNTEPLTWFKGHAASNRFIYELATRPHLIDWLVPLLGKDIVLWGANIIKRKPGQVHYWHTDIESAALDGGFVSLWIGIENTTHESSLKVIPGSHLYGVPLQAAAVERQLAKKQLVQDMAVELARSYDGDAELYEPAVTNGEAIIFDGRLWHGTHNVSSNKSRMALLLQYASARTPVRIYDQTKSEWPIPLLHEPLPPVIAVSGNAQASVNRLVDPPAPGKGYESVISTLIKPLRLPLEESGDKTRAHYPVMRGPTAMLADMRSHVSVLSPGRSAHPPHIHPHEEILIVLDGEADIVLSDDAEGANKKTIKLRPGSFTYYPSGQYHTIENSGSAPVTYLMFKWLAEGVSGAKNALPTSVLHYGDWVVPESNSKARQSKLVIEGPTGELGKLHCHVSQMPVGGGYKPHEDPYDVAIVMLSGEAETLGQTIRAHDIVFYSADTPHGLRNTGNVPARYLVFEFHVDPVAMKPRPKPKQQATLAAAAY